MKVLQLRYDDDFVEAAVFTAASGKRPGVPSLQIRRFHVERERCYSVLDPDQRNAAFFKLHLDWFREWGMEKLLLGLVGEYPPLSPALTALAFRKVRVKKDEGAELYVSAAHGRTAVVAMRPERFECDETVASLLRHEFMHLSDMVDVRFGYSPDVQRPGLNPTQERITRERYRLLWDITVDARLTRAGHGLPGTRERHEAHFHRAFSFWPEARREEVFEAHWTTSAPRHEALLALAADPRNLAHSTALLPGSPCPLCHFPTFEWADTSALPTETRSRLSAAFPQWAPGQGACKRCVEIHELAGKLELPPTVVL
jgi:hypothetical protein